MGIIIHARRLSRYVEEECLGGSETLEYGMIGGFLADLKRGFSREDNETMKVVELKKVEQENRTMKEFVQEFRKIVRSSRYKERLLVEEFKQGMNRVIRRKLIEAEQLSKSIEQ